MEHKHKKGQTMKIRHVLRKSVHWLYVGLVEYGATISGVPVQPGTDGNMHVITAETHTEMHARGIVR